MLTALREATWTLDGDPQSVGLARNHARNILAQWGLAALIDDVLLVLSELVTNSLVHGSPPIQLSLYTYGHALRGEVSDCSFTKPEPLAVDFDDEHGRGLALIQAYTTRWGVDPLATGKSVWALWQVTP